MTQPLTAVVVYRPLVATVQPFNQTKAKNKVLTRVSLRLQGDRFPLVDKTLPGDWSKEQLLKDVRRNPRLWEKVADLVDGVTEAQIRCGNRIVATRTLLGEHIAPVVLSMYLTDSDGWTMHVIPRPAAVTMDAA